MHTGAFELARYNILILEDDPQFQGVLRRMVDVYPGRARFDVNTVADALSLESFLAQGSRVDILVCDINLGEGSPDGINLVAKHFPAGCGTKVLYVTGFVDYCSSVYRTEHTYFLLKPVDQAILNEALDKAVSQLESQKTLVPIKHSNTLTMVDPDRIEYIESDLRKVHLHFIDGKQLDVYAKLGDVSDVLPSNFVRCHMSYLVNMSQVVELRKRGILLQSGVEVPVSQSRKKPTEIAFYGYVGLSSDC